MNKYRVHIAMTFLFGSCILMAQYRLPGQDSVLSIIQSKQSEGGLLYDEGLFESKRIAGKKVFDDNALFFSALIAVTLGDLKGQLDGDGQQKSERIIERVKKNINKYQNRNGGYTFNFWQTSPDIPHPNAEKKYQTDKYKLPDDFDDTSVIGLLVGDTFSEHIRREMTTYTEKRQKKIKTTLRRFRKTEAYGVWYADKWKQEMDLAVLANTLLFVFKNQFELNKYDSASINLIEEIVRADLHLKKPFLISPFYTEPPVILYHLARLLDEDKNGTLAHLENEIIADLYAVMVNEENEMNRLMMATSLLRLDEDCQYEPNHHALSLEIQRYNFFSANIMSAFGAPVFYRRIFKKSKLLPQMQWHCEAYNWMLYFEYLVLSRDSFDDHQVQEVHIR